jgi:hypothetical protein
MDKPAYKLVILFDTDQGQVSGALLEDLAMIMSQYGLKPATLNISENDEPGVCANGLTEDGKIPGGPRTPTMEKDKKTHEPRVLRFPVERTRRSDDSDPV